MQATNRYIPLFVIQAINAQVTEETSESRYQDFNFSINQSKFIINRCRVMGYVTSVDNWLNQKLTITIDDGTANIKCLRWFDDGMNTIDGNLFKLGDLVEVSGRLLTFRNILQMNIEQWRIAKSMLEESQFWISCIEVQKDLVKEHERQKLVQTQKPKRDFVDEDDEEFGYNLLQYLSSFEPDYEFYVSILLEQDSRIQELFATVEQAKNKIIAKHERLQILNRVLDRLFASNFIISCSENADKTASPEIPFKLITMAHHLGPEITKYIAARQSKSEQEQAEGVPLGFILKDIQMQKQFRRIEPHMIKQCIEYLINESILYESRAQCYKVVN